MITLDIATRNITTERMIGTIGRLFFLNLSLNSFAENPQKAAEFCV